MFAFIVAAIFALATFDATAQGQTAEEKLAEAYRLLQEVLAECQAPLPDPPDPDTPPLPPPQKKEAWECYLARYPDVAERGPHNWQWVKRHWDTWGRNERRCLYCDGDDRIATITPWCVPDDGGDNGGDASVGARVTIGSGFLWKPVSESRGGVLTILLPSNFSDNNSLVVNGERPKEDRGRTNGNRPTYFFPRSGGSYPNPVRFTVNGREYCMLDPGKRHENGAWNCD